MDEKKLLRQVIDINPHLIFVKDREGRFTLVNEAIGEVYGTTVEDLVGKTDADFNPRKEEVERFRRDDLEVMDRRVEKHVEEVITDSQGRLRHLSTIKRPLIGSDGRCSHVLGVATDITALRHAEAERSALEARVQHAQKLESLGILAGGIAHDFNNLLVGVLANADVALRKLGPATPAAASLELIRVAARRAADLCRQMLAYAGRAQLEVAPLSVTEVIEDVRALLAASISKKARLRTDLAARLPLVQGDATQIRQVVMNLITNASDALGDETGTITVETGVTDLTREQLRDDHARGDATPGRYVYVRVSDTGCGMDRATLCRIFDPFFTTKFSGRGLGLAAVLGIVRAHRGAIRVQSELGRGTTVSFYLPVASGAPLEVEPDADAAGGRRDKILVVDDEPLVLTAVHELLTLEGISVLTATDGREAVEVFRRSSSEIAGVLLDMTMPSKNGYEVLRELRATHADLPVVLMSGFEETDAAGRADDVVPTGFLRKPFTADELLAAIRRLRAHTA